MTPLEILLSIALVVAIGALRLNSLMDAKWEREEVNNSWRLKADAIRERDAMKKRLYAAYATLKGKDLTFRHFQQINDERSKALFPQCQEWTESEWMMALIGEVGEAANILKKRLRGVEEIPPLSKVGDELADVLCYISLLCTYLGLDMQDIMRCKFNQTTLRFGEGQIGPNSLKEYML